MSNSNTTNVAAAPVATSPAKKVRNLLAYHVTFPDAIYDTPNRPAFFNGMHSLMLSNMGVGETIAAADPEQREWMFLLSIARKIGESPQYPLDDYLDPLSRVPLSCMPAMLWLHKEDPASYQWILDNLDAAHTREPGTILSNMHCEASIWTAFAWCDTPQGMDHWVALLSAWFDQLVTKSQS